MDQGRLTQGDIIRQLIALSGPLLLGNILQQLYNAVDAVIVGRFVGSTAFGAVGVAGSVMNLFLFLISGGCDGVGTLLAQFCGGDNRSAFRREFFLSGIFGAGASLVLTALGLLALEPLLALLRTPDSVAVCARAYLQIIFLGFPAAFAFHLSSRVLRAVGNTRAGLAFLALSMGVNLALDLVLVAGLSMGVQGAALATVLAQALAALLCGGYLRLRFPQLMFGREDMVLDLPLLRRTARFSAVTALHMCNLYIGKLLVQGAVNSLGEEAINAFTAATRVEGFANSFGDSGAEATAIFYRPEHRSRPGRPGAGGLPQGPAAAAGPGGFHVPGHAPLGGALPETGAPRRQSAGPRGRLSADSGLLLRVQLPGQRPGGLLPGPGPGQPARHRRHRPHLPAGPALLPPDACYGTARRGAGHRAGLDGCGHILVYPGRG